MAGYSGTPLVKKLGIKAEHRVAVLAAPKGFDRELQGLPPQVDMRHSLRGTAVFDVIIWFNARRSRLERDFERVAGRLPPTGGLWLAWPKKSSGQPTDITEAVVRETGLGGGLVDNKICAINETWSGLRFVVRLKDRPRKTKKR